MMNRILGLLLALIVLGGLAWYFTKQTDKGGSSTALTERQFKVEQVDDIGRIFLADRRGNTTDLRRKGDHWVLSDGALARPEAIDMLLDAVRRIEVQYQPGHAAVDNVVRDIATHGIKVEIYDRQGKAMRKYYIGGGTATELGTHAIVEGEDQPQVVHIPGWQGNLRFRYNLTGDEWRDRHVLPLGRYDWQSFTVDYPKQQEMGFHLERNGSDYTVRPMASHLIGQPRSYKSRSAEIYFDQWTDMIAEGFDNEYLGKDSIAAQVPFSKITGVMTNGDTLSWLFHPMSPSEEYDPHTKEMVSKGPTHRYYVTRSDGDFMIAQHRVLKPIFRSYEFFLNE